MAFLGFGKSEAENNFDEARTKILHTHNLRLDKYKQFITLINMHLIGSSSSAPSIQQNLVNFFYKLYKFAYTNSGASEGNIYKKITLDGRDYTFDITELYDQEILPIAGALDTLQQAILRDNLITELGQLHHNQLLIQSLTNKIDNLKNEFDRNIFNQAISKVRPDQFEVYDYRQLVPAIVNEFARIGIAVDFNKINTTDFIKINKIKIGEETYSPFTIHFKQILNNILNIMQLVPYNLVARFIVEIKRKGDKTIFSPNIIAIANRNYLTKQDLGSIKLIASNNGFTKIINSLEAQGYLAEVV